MKKANSPFISFELSEEANCKAPSSDDVDSVPKVCPSS